MNEVEARELLAVDVGASPTELKAAYRSRLKAWHPDLFDPDSAPYADAVERTRRVIAAYALLGGKPREKEDLAELSPLAEWYGKPVHVINRNENLLIWGGLVALIALAVTVGLILS